MISLLVLVLFLLLIGGGIWGWPLVAAAFGLSSVTDKPGALQHIKQLMNTYDILPAEVEAAFHAPASADASPSSAGATARLRNARNDNPAKRRTKVRSGCGRS